MSEAQSVLNMSTIGNHAHFVSYSVTLLALASIFGAIYYISKKRNRRSRYKVKLLQKKYITHDTVVFTFLLPNTRKNLGLKIGQHVQIEAIIDGKVTNRKYTPISRIDRKHTFQLLVKIYNKTEQFPTGGIMSQYLDLLQINDEIDITLPYGRFNYQKAGQVKIATLDKKTIKRKFKNFFMVAGGTGITPLYQIIQYISENQKQVPINLTLLFANRTEEDILLMNQLKQYEKQNKNLKIFFSVDKSIKSNWDGFVGYIDEQKVSKALGQFVNDIQNTIFLSCGPPILSNIVQKIWRTTYNVKAQHMFRF